MQAAIRCPSHAFVYNGSLCACNPGYVYNSSRYSCAVFAERGPVVLLRSGVQYDSALGIPGTIFSFDTIKKFTQSQAVFLEATLVILLCWLGFCFLLRLFPLGSDGRSLWFKIRWCISRLDVSFATRHWLHDQTPVVKRKTELGGTLSIASWILFVGLFAALLYQIISKRSIEVHNIRATNQPDLASFLNDIEFNITTISSMSCAQLRGLGTLVSVNPVFINQRVVPLSTFANYSCLNTTSGPTITLKCNKCRLVRDFAYISWQFVDLPSSPASAVGFQFNITAKNHEQEKHLSFVSGTVTNADDIENKLITYRGAMPSILKFNLFPRIYHNLHDLKLIQPLFHEFLPGSYFSEVSELQGSLESSNEGLINTTVCVNYLSSYIVEIDNQNILGPVSFLADLGGLYCISIGIFFYFLVQCEYRIKRLRNEDSRMRQIRNRCKAQEHWDKLRKYVSYTWGPCSLDDWRNEPNKACCTGVMTKSFHQSGSSRRRGLQKRMDAVSFNRKVTLPNEKKQEPENVHTQEVVKTCSTEAATNLGNKPSFSRDELECQLRGNVDYKKYGGCLCSHLGDVCSNPGPPPPCDVLNLPTVPSFEFTDSGDMNMLDFQKNLQKLYEYNVMLTEKFKVALLKDNYLTKNDPSSSVMR